MVAFLIALVGLFLIYYGLKVIKHNLIVLRSNLEFKVFFFLATISIPLGSIVIGLLFLLMAWKIAFLD